MTLGRDSRTGVYVNDPSVSREHAQIVEKDGNFYLRDLSSANGTFLNGERVSETDYLLSDGDAISLGGSKVSYVFQTAPAETQQLTIALSLDRSVDAEASPPPDGEFYDGQVRPKVVTEGGMGQVVAFRQRLEREPEFRVTRMTNVKGGVELLVGLREPVSLTRRLGEMEGVDQVSVPLGHDLSPGDPDMPLTVRLKSQKGAAKSFPCVNCKSPLKPGTTLCPHCRKPQT